MEPVLIRDHPAMGQYKPELEAKQIIFKCRNSDYGLSAITAKGSRFGEGESLGHGFYCDNQPGLPTQYEVMLLRDIHQENGEWQYELVPGIEPIGWLYIEEIGRLLEEIDQLGPETYNHFRRSDSADSSDSD